MEAELNNKIKFEIIAFNKFPDCCLVCDNISQGYYKEFYCDKTGVREVDLFEKCDMFFVHRVNKKVYNEFDEVPEKKPDPPTFIESVCKVLGNKLEDIKVKCLFSKKVKSEEPKGYYSMFDIHKEE